MEHIMKRNIIILLSGLLLCAAGCDDDKEKKDPGCVLDTDCLDAAKPFCRGGVCVPKTPPKEKIIVTCLDRSDCEEIEGWANGTCEESVCVAKTCQTGYHVCNEEDCDAVCEKDDIYNCGAHEYVCAAQVSDWIDGICDNAQCIPSECNFGFHPYASLGSCEMDDSSNCGEHGAACQSKVQNWKRGRCVNSACYAMECLDGFFASGGKCYPNGEVPPDPPPVLECLDGEHVYENGCELNSNENCGSHGNRCKGWELCDSAGECRPYPCDSGSDSAFCDDETGYVVFCGSKEPNAGVYYVSSSKGMCTSENPCVVCPDGFGGCSNDAQSFCVGHGTNIDPKPQELPSYCNAKSPNVCWDGKLYKCISGRYEENQQCSASEICVTCENNKSGCSTTHAENYCGDNSNPMNTDGQCIKDHLRCDGKKLMKCDGKSYSILEETCENYCMDGTNGENSSCSESVPSCTLKEGTVVSVNAWNDGDTAVVTPISNDNSCNPEKMRIRILGIDTPECSKQFSYTYYANVCIEDPVYTSTNDPGGYEALQKALTLIEPRSLATVHCAATDAYGRCTKDNTQASRSLVYLSKGSIDFSTEMMRSGLTMPNLRHPSLLPQNKGICKALQEAMENKRGLFKDCVAADQDCITKAGSTLYSTKPSEFDNVAANCQYILRNMPDE